MVQRILVLCIILPLIAAADDIVTLFDRVTQSDLYNSQKETIEKELQNKRAALYSDGWSIGGGTTYADFDSGENGMEYQLTLSKEIMIHSSQLATLFKQNKNYAQILKKVKENRLKALIFRLYGQYCITMDSLQTKGELAATYDLLNTQIQKGVELGEFSSNKAIMSKLQYQNIILEISKLESRLQEYEAQIKSLVEFDGQFECGNHSLDFNKLFLPESSAYIDLLQKQKEAARTTLDVASNKLRTASADLSYTQELDTQRYTLNLTLPLSYDNTQYEANKASALHNYTALNYRIKALLKRYKEETEALKTRLNIYHEHVSKTEASIKQDSSTLIYQSGLRFKAGEESLIEMLKATQTRLQIAETILLFKQQRHQAVSDYLYNYAINPQGVLK